MNAKDLEEALEMGMDWSLREGYVWAEDKVCMIAVTLTKCRILQVFHTTL